MPDMHKRKEIEIFCLLGTISNSDTSFEMNSGYGGQIHDFMPVDISWQKEEPYSVRTEKYWLLWKVEVRPTGTNLMYGQDAVLDYDLSGLGEITGIKISLSRNMMIQKENILNHFVGRLLFIAGPVENMRRFRKWEKVFDRTELEKYLSADGTLRVRYQVADDMDVTDKNCTLPCLQITGKVVTPDA